jgi:hypothetical protein
MRLALQMGEHFDLTHRSAEGTPVRDSGVRRRYATGNLPWGKWLNHRRRPSFAVGGQFATGFKRRARQIPHCDINETAKTPELR